MKSKILSVCVALGVLIAFTGGASATCGTRGGPGYRGPDGQCVGWADLGRKCGNPPSSRCKPELAQPEAPAAAQRGRDIQKFKEDAHERATRN